MGKSSTPVVFRGYSGGWTATGAARRTQETLGASLRNRLYRAAMWPFVGGFPRELGRPLAVAWNRIEFEGKSSPRLVGLHRRSTKRRKATVVMAPPMTPDAKAYFLDSNRVELLLDAGCDVLLLDYGGFGESEPGNFDWPNDIISAGELARRLSPELPAVLYGLSLGAGFGICALGTPGHPYHAAIIESPFSHPSEYLRRRKLEWFAYCLAWPFFRQTILACTPIRRAANIRGLERVLFVYCEDDRISPPSAVEAMIRAIPLPAERAERWLVRDTRHAKADVSDPSEYRLRITSFLVRALGE